MLTGENGLLTKAMEAKEEYQRANAQEKLELAITEYTVKMKEETLISIIKKIEGFEKIEPDDISGPPYTVVIDGYKFKVKEDLSIEYLGKDNGIIPEIISIEKIVQDEEKVIIEIKAKTEDKEGLKEIRIVKDGVELDENIQIDGKEIIKEYEIRENGKYKIKIIGKNGKEKISEEIEITGLKNISGTIDVGTLSDAQIILTVNANVQEGNIQTIQIYDEKGDIIQEKNYTDQETKKTEKITIDVPFFVEKTYYAKIKDSYKNEIDTNKVKRINEEYIKTEIDLNNLGKIVNEGINNFEGKKEIKQVADITLTQNHIAIGTENNPFKGTYNGQEKKINNLKINNNNNFQGLFGYIRSSTIKNVKLGIGSVKGGNRIGGIVGYANSSNLENIVNEGTTINGNVVYTEIGNYVTGESFGRNISEWKKVTCCSVGGIIGKAENTSIRNCSNTASIKHNQNVEFIGGIVRIY